MIITSTLCLKYKINSLYNLFERIYSDKFSDEIDSQLQARFYVYIRIYVYYYAYFETALRFGSNLRTVSAWV